MGFYADNFYISSKRGDQVAYVSADGEKMECSHDVKDFEMYTEEILKEYDEVNPDVARVWKEIAIVSSVQAPVLLGNKLIRQKWLSSGVYGTADYNCLKMA